MNAHLRASTESQNSEHFHCWRQTLPLRGVLFHPASEKEIVRDVTEKRLLHCVLIATQNPNRLPQRRRLFVMSQRNVCYIVFSSRHRVHVADLSFPCVTKRSSTFRIKCGDDGFHQGSLDIQHHRVRETYSVHSRRRLVSPTLETTSPASSRFSTSVFFREMPNSRRCDGFSEHLQIVLFTLGDPELNVVYNATADVWHVPRELEVMVRVLECGGCS